MINKEKKNKVLKLAENRRYEWPIVVYWYTRKEGQTIEQIIDTDVTFFEWAVSNFQNVTPKQAAYYTEKTGNILPQQVIQDVEPYEWRKGDPERLYIEICDTQNLAESIYKYRGAEQLSLF